MKNLTVKKIVLYASLCSILVIAFVSKNSAHEEIKLDSAFGGYWYRGAEITSYELNQARYGEIHKGKAVLIFVTENLLPDKQVKSEDPSRPSSAVVPVLKLNFVKKFNTGIYDYSLMKSVFTPININKYPHTLKVSGSSQEWCGNMYSQINLRDNRYNIIKHSYFEKEVKQDFSINQAFLEDEVWTRIRISPYTLPTGSVKMVPGTFHSMLKHVQQKPENVKASLKEKDSKTMRYTLEYEDAKRTLLIDFSKLFPFEIQGWEETKSSGYGKKAKVLTTKAVKIKTVIMNYWSMNKNSDLYLRDKLGVN